MTHTIAKPVAQEAAALRALADWLEAQPDLPGEPHFGVRVQHSCTREQVEQIAYAYDRPVERWTQDRFEYLSADVRIDLGDGRYAEFVACARFEETS